jgi:1-acyl-sn-glycerol-3-phosphate acyltransferase
LLYGFLKIISRLAMHIYCRKVVINKPEMLCIRGPVLLACNHPNSFLDSVILDTLFREPVWSLARGDVFKKPLYIRILSALRILPVYRTSEGVENLSENYKTFEACIDIFRKNGIITIFSEGKCVNEWHLRPLKKGTARLALKAWSEKIPSGDENIPLRVLPVGINYSSFRLFGKNVFIRFGEIIDQPAPAVDASDGRQHLAFNTKLQEQLQRCVVEIQKNDRRQKKEQLEITIPAWKKMLLAIPALLGWISHAPLYLPVKSFVKRKTFENDHFDSVMTGILLFTYPLYLLLLTGLLYVILQSKWAFLLLLLLPFLAWACVQLKKQID